MLDLIVKNPALAGFAGTAIAGFVFYALRAVPAKILELLGWWSTVTLTVTGQDEVFDWVNEWLAEHEYSQRARTLKLSTGRSSNERWTMAPGFGTHVFWDQGLVVLRRHTDEKSAGGGWQARPRENITVTTFGRSQSRVRRMIDEAGAKRARGDALSIRVWSGGFWQPVSSKDRRSLDTVFLPADQKREIVELARWFLDNRPWFAERGLPYRYGYLLSGPPGTGKTSLVTALASHLERPVYIVNLASMGNDNELLSAFNSAARGCVLLIEDVDAVQLAAARARAPEPKAGEPVGVPVSAVMTLSGLLNAIDGVGSCEDRILVMTTNHPEKLDPALVRSARVDRRFEIGLMAPAEVREMAARFFPGRPELADAAYERARVESRRAAADWVGDFMRETRSGDRSL